MRLRKSSPLTQVSLEVEGRICAWHPTLAPHTALPSTMLPLLSHGSTANIAECGSKGVAVKPRKGDALLFHSLHIDGG